MVILETLEAGRGLTRLFLSKTRWPKQSFYFVFDAESKKHIGLCSFFVTSSWLELGKLYFSENVILFDYRIYRIERNDFLSALFAEFESKLIVFLNSMLKMKLTNIFLGSADPQWSTMSVRPPFCPSFCPSVTL